MQLMHGFIQLWPDRIWDIILNSSFYSVLPYIIVCDQLGKKFHALLRGICFPWCLGGVSVDFCWVHLIYTFKATVSTLLCFSDDLSIDDFEVWKYAVISILVLICDFTYSYLCFMKLSAHVFREYTLRIVISSWWIDFLMSMK